VRALIGATQIKGGYSFAASNRSPAEPVREKD
jgi:hypothetical protein